MARSRGRTGAAWRRACAIVRVRDTHCWICRLPIDFNLDGQRHPMGFTVDHLMPIKRVAPDDPRLTDPQWLAAAHRRCNSSRGAGKVKRDAAKTTRDW